MTLDSTQKRALKSKAHHLKPIVLLGAKGLSDSVVAEIDLALTAHELMKVKLTGIDNESRKAVANDIASRLNADVIQIIGQVLTLYRPQEATNQVSD